MISNLIELGGELIQNNQEDYGFLINNDDIILQIIYNENTEKFELGDINKKEDCVFNFLEESYFKNNLPTPLNTQDITISNQNGLMGFSPFVLLFDHDFLGQKIKPERYDDEENFYEFNSERYKFRKKRSKFKVNLAIGKIKVTYEQNKNNNQFNKFIDLVFDNVDKNFLEKINMFKDSSIYIDNFFNKFNSSFIKDLINQYLEFLYINSNDIIDKIIDYEMNSENRKSLRNKYLFIVCSFGDEKDLINDFFYDYCKFIKEKNENIIPYEDGFC